MHKPLAAVLVAAAAIGLLTACATPVGGDAEKWLLTSDIVESVDTDGHYDGFTFIPTVTAVIDGAATDAQMRELTLASSEYLGGEGRRNLSITLSIEPFSIDVPADDSAAAAAELWAAARADDRIASGRFSGTEATIAVAQAEIVTVFPQYAPGLQALTVHSDDDEYDARYQLSGTATCFDAAESSVAALFGDASLVAVRLDACISGRVVTEADALLATAERLAVDLAEAPFDLTVIYSGSPGSWTTRASREVPLALVTPELLGLLRTIEVRDPLAMRLADNGTLEVEVEPGDLQSAAASILLDPGFGSTSPVVLTTPGITVHLASITETPAVLALAQGFVDLGLANSFFFAADGEVRFSIGASDYTEQNAKRVVDLALSNDVWRTSSIYIGDTRNNGATFTDGDPVTAEGELAEAVVEYWLRSV